MAHYLICYDIADPKRLGKVHRKAVKHAIFIQYSVYYLHGNQQQLERLLDELRQVIDETEDDIRAYTVSPLDDAIMLGKSWLPSGVHWV